MTVHDTRDAVTTPAIPRPRPPRDDTPVEESPADDHAPEIAVAPRGTVGEFPWPEPWHFSRGALPRSEYWDVTTASWHSRGPRLTRS